MLGERLKRAREKKGFTQVYVKNRTGINNKTISGYENGVSEPDSQTLIMLADIYEVSVDWLMGREKVNTPTWTEEETHMIEKFNNLSDRDQLYILELMERLKKEQR